MAVRRDGELAGPVSLRRLQSPARIGNVRPGMGGAALPYRPQLDGLRCLAALSVLVCHFAPQGGRVLGAFRWGDAGVQLFFVLSGFLITSIVLRIGVDADRAGQRTAVTLRRFYARRFLRILPPYYALLAVTAALNVPGVRDAIGWHLTYTTNVHLARVGEWRDNVFHFWTLAVEEQFYLVWPAVILWGPRRLLAPCCLVAMMAGPAYRLVATQAGWTETMVYVLPIANVDTLAAGALLALLGADPASRGAHDRLLALGRRVGIPVALATIVARNLGVPEAVESHVWRASLVLVGPWLVAGATTGFGGMARRVLESRPALYLGKVSYGIYLYHVFAPLVVDRVAPSLGLGAVPHVVTAAAWSVVTLGVAVLSWHLLEAPLARRRRRLPYVVAAPRDP